MPGRWEPSRFCDSDDSDRGVIIDGGITRNEFETRTQQEMNRVETIAPWHKPSKYLKYRNGIEALYLGLSDSINGKYTGGHNIYHADSAQNLPIRTADAQAVAKWDIAQGEPFVEQVELCTGLGGDDGECSNWPIRYKNICIVILRIHQYKKHLTHSLYGSILLLLCSKSSKHLPARYHILKICEQLSNLKHLTVWNIKLSAWSCLPHSFLGCHDWVFECCIYGFLSHASNTFLHCVMLIVCGKPKPLDIKKHKLYEWFLTGIDRNNYNIDLAEWRRGKKTGIVLTTTELVRYQWEEKLRPALIEFQETEDRNGNLHKWEDDEYSQTKMSDLAKSIGTNLNKNPLTNWDYNIYMDSMHAFHTYCERQTETTIYTVIQICGNKKLAKECVGKAGLEWLNHDFSKYIKKVSVKRVNHKWSFNATGPRYRELNDRLYYILLATGWIEYHKIENALSNVNIDSLRNGNLSNIAVNWDLFLPTLKLAVKYVTRKHMRRAYAAMLKQSIEIVDPSQVPPTIQCMLDHYRDGWDLIVTEDTEMVFNFEYCIVLCVLYFWCNVQHCYKR